MARFTLANYSIVVVEHLQDSEIIELDSEISKVQRVAGGEETERLIPFLLEK